MYLYLLIKKQAETLSYFLFLKHSWFCEFSVLYFQSTALDLAKPKVKREPTGGHEDIFPCRSL